VVSIRLSAALLIVVLPIAIVPDGPLIIAHRGASGYRPEHTLEAYRLAIEMGADFIEPDLVSTKDGVLIARHEHEIGATTDVEARFPDRRRTKTIEGQAVSGWFTEDFTLAEIKTLRARERLASRTHEYDGRFPVPTFDEVIDLAERAGRERNRVIGVYPETKHPTYFQSIGLALEDKLVASLVRAGWNRQDAPVFIQSFETANLRALRTKTRARLIQLVSDAAQVTSDGLKTIAAYADGIGPEKQLVQPVTAAGALGPPTDLVARAHALGLLVHVWTLRMDKEFLPAGYQGNPEAEFQRFRELGVDGLFTDFPDVGVKALRRQEPRAKRR
jgi:glycerophosphoryl diester phosphodiesterase